MAQSLATLPDHVKGQIVTKKFLQIIKIQNKNETETLKELQLQQSYLLTLVLLLSTSERAWLLFLASLQVFAY